MSTNELAVDFGVKDSKGRALGCVVTIKPAFKYIPNPALVENGGTETCGMGCIKTDEQDGWEVRISSTRDGKWFGAYRYPTHAATMEEAQKLAQKKIAQSRSRVLRAAAKTGGVYLTGRAAKV
jgi:hypothetical protein